jgi:FtsP/CotA-like multicopper oxidase with cupredoxin domain
MSLSQPLLQPVLGNVGFINTFLSSLGATLGAGIATIPAFIQNGESPLGLLPVPVLPDFLGGSDSNDVPWGNRTAGDSAYEDPPDTGRTRYYDFTVSRAFIAPDGVEKRAIIVNGQYPGPTIEADWGDWIEVIVRNNITGPEDGTAIHMHGYTQSTMVTVWDDN